eukprot:CAMPEP_0203660880 /NCGR_PEP_ID=MMETSP0088-20131115/58269_1 /ASSEMBLY_ACC=CAM_ASM_001087 /TAXON_ID=426623 /ORGANISM="Chaetoceros affinis, Strain CCMP159" /LENGTH=252 /DNA_ID=CAMNT_0050523415 /DNA_START=1 /DNA_END=759 /DNA_ORIENTATION=+
MSSKIVWLLLHLLATQSFSFLISTSINKPSCVQLDASSPVVEINRKNNDSLAIQIERVSSRNRVLDVQVFRGFSISASEFIHKQRSELNVTISEKDAISQLTPSYDDDGKELDSIGDPVTQFTALACHRTDNRFSSQEEYTRGVVIGAVDAKIRRSPSSLPSLGDPGILVDELLWPHVSLKNLSVDKDFRRMGVASALVRAVKVFAIEEKMTAVILEVEHANTGAVNLYEKEGFVFVDEEETIGGKMILVLE